MRGFAEGKRERGVNKRGERKKDPLYKGGVLSSHVVAVPVPYI